MNLFDFSSALPDYSSLNPTAKALAKPVKAPTAGAFGGGMSPPTINSAPLPRATSSSPQNKGSFSIIPEASASEEKDLLQSYLDDTTVSRKDRETVFQMIDDGLEVGEIEGIIKGSGY